MTTNRHPCPGLEPGAGQRLIEVLRTEPLIQSALRAVAASGLPDAWIGAGCIRDVVWGRRYHRFDPAEVRDIDVAYFDPANLSKEAEQSAEQDLRNQAELPWEATNQAAVHTWYQEYFGGPPVEPFRSVHDAVATWPETATCVAIRQTQADIEVCAPHGLADLLDGIWRVNPVRVIPAVSMARLQRQRVRERWPGVTVVLPR